jgi:hypothetical protein
MTKDEALKLALEGAANYIDALGGDSRKYRQALAAPVQEPVAWKWHQAPVKTQWGDDMVVADIAIDKDHTVSIYCERDQAAKVEAMFTPPAAPVQEPVKCQYGNGGYACCEGGPCKADEQNNAAPVQEPAAKRKLIGWRTEDFLRETTDIKTAQNWEVHYEVLPIFEGDTNTKLTTPPAAQRQWVGLTDDEVIKCTPTWGGTVEDVARSIEAKLKEKNTP